MPNTYTLIASNTVGSGGVTSFTFSSIPSTYTDLVLNMSLRSTSATDASSSFAIVRFNSSTSNYSTRRLYAYDGTTVGSDTSAGQDTVYGGTTGTTNTFNNDLIYISNYASANNKPIYVDNVSEQNSATKYWLGLYSWLWSNSAAISSINVLADVGSFAQYSSFYLYGISKS
jgi:hypothetical protein